MIDIKMAVKQLTLLLLILSFKACAFRTAMVQQRLRRALVKPLRRNAHSEQYLSSSIKTAGLQPLTWDEVGALLKTSKANVSTQFLRNDYSSAFQSLLSMIAYFIRPPLMDWTNLKTLFSSVTNESPKIESLVLCDLQACAGSNTGPALASAFFNYKGFHSLVVHRIAHRLLESNRSTLSRCLQSLNSRAFGADINPACVIGASCCLSNSADVVIGETAVIGDGCTLSHCVTLGGTGKESGDRHPKLGNGVTLGVGATVLGNIKLGDGCIVDASSVVTKSVDPMTRVAGVPAKVILITQ